MASCSFFTGSKPGSVFSLTRREGEGEGRPPSLMTRAPPQGRRPSGVSCGSGLTGRSAGEPEEREPEPDDEEVHVFIRRGVVSYHDIGRRRGHRVLQARRVASLDVLEDGFEAETGDAPPLAPPLGVEAASGLDNV